MAEDNRVSYGSDIENIILSVAGIDSAGNCPPLALARHQGGEWFIRRFFCFFG